MTRFGMFESEHPRALVMVACERIIVEAGTGRRSLIGIFDALDVAAFPITIVGLNFHVEVARGVKDEIEMYFGFFAPSGEAIVQSTLTVSEWKDGYVNFDIMLPSIPIPSEGIYDLRLFVADHVLSQRQLLVRKSPQSSEGQGDSPTPGPSQ